MHAEDKASSTHIPAIDLPAIFEVADRISARGNNKPSAESLLNWWL
jgi:hypothetical protein